jgi:phage/plasmid-like protein (TIGR03299 family)
MSAEFTTGFSVREVPWHGLGKVLDDYPSSWAEVRRLAGLEWDPIERAVYDVTEMYADGTAKVSLIPNFKQVIRSDNGALLDIAMDTYHLIDHDTMGEIFEAVRGESRDTVKFETAGALQEGKKVWVLARIGDAIELPGDPSPMQPYMALLNAHDGTAALRVMNTNVRIVCMNTWHAAEVSAERRGSAFAFRHTKNWRDQVEQAKKALATTREQIEHTVEQARQMLSVKVTKIQRELFIKQFAEERVLANTVGREKFSRSELSARMDSTRVQEALRVTVVGLTQILASQTCEGINDTVWGLVQAAGEFTDHHRESKSAESKFARQMLEAKEPLKVTAVKLAREVLSAA